MQLFHSNSLKRAGVLLSLDLYAMSCNKNNISLKFFQNNITWLIQINLQHFSSWNLIQPIKTARSVKDGAISVVTNVYD